MASMYIEVVEPIHGHMCARCRLIIVWVHADVYMCICIYNPRFLLLICISPGLNSVQWRGVRHRQSFRSVTVLCSGPSFTSLCVTRCRQVRVEIYIIQLHKVNICI